MKNQLNSSHLKSVRERDQERGGCEGSTNVPELFVHLQLLIKRPQLIQNLLRLVKTATHRVRFTHTHTHTHTHNHQLQLSQHKKLYERLLGWGKKMVYWTHSLALAAMFRALLVALAASLVLSSTRCSSAQARW